MGGFDDTMIYVMLVQAGMVGESRFAKKSIDNLRQPWYDEKDTRCKEV